MHEPMSAMLYYIPSYFLFIWFSHFVWKFDTYQLCFLTVEYAIIKHLIPLAMLWVTNVTYMPVQFSFLRYISVKIYFSYKILFVRLLYCKHIASTFLRQFVYLKYFKSYMMNHNILTIKVVWLGVKEHWFMVEILKTE
jgi:hypothetical protein